MANRKDTTAVNHSHLNEFAQVVERIGLSIGFYLRTNIPLLPSGAACRAHSESGSAPRTNPIALASAIGTFLAAVAALVSVYVIVFDEDPPVIWNIGIGLWWMLGVLLQLAAGTAARLGQFRGATG